MDTNTQEQENPSQNEVTSRYNETLDRLIIQKFKTKQDFALAVGCSRSLISQFVHGLKQPGIPMKIKIAGVLGVDSRTIWPEGGDGHE